MRVRIKSESVRIICLCQSKCAGNKKWKSLYLPSLPVVTQTNSHRLKYVRKSTPWCPFKRNFAPCVWSQSSSSYVLILVQCVREPLLRNWFNLKGKSSKNNGLFMVRLTVRVDPPPLMVRVSWFFQNKLRYFDLFYHFIMGKLDQNFHICLG